MNRITLAAGIYLLNIADLVSTHIGLNRGAVEANPYMVGLAGSGIGAFLKLAVVGGVLAGMVYIGKRMPKTAIATLSLVAIAYLGVVAGNLAVISTLS